MGSFKRGQKQGFTLVEIMMVVGITGILAIAVGPKASDLVTNASQAKTKANLGSLRSAINIYYSDTEGQHPQDLFTALTNDNKYMPLIGGRSSLGVYEIPKNTKGNPGHETAFFANCDSSACVDNNTSLNIDDDTEALAYVTSGPEAGRVAINCSHVDTKSVSWDSY